VENWCHTRPLFPMDLQTPVRAQAPVEGEGLTVSFRAEVPEALLAAMRGFIEQHPNWDQYRLFQAALAGFLVQNGLGDREVTRCYLANLFPAQASFKQH
jgi:hypothetical protein